MEELYRQKKVRAIGVSNFSIEYLEMIANDSEINPMVNQVERHPFYTQTDLYQYCAPRNIALEAYSPLAQGDIFEVDALKNLARKYNKTIAQIVLRWELETDYITFPKSTHHDRIKENFEIFDFQLDSEDRDLISGLDLQKKYGSYPEDTYELDKF